MPEFITDSGTVLGCFSRKTGPERGFIERHGKFTILNDPAAGKNGVITACPLGVNDSGTVVGFYEKSSGQASGFIERHGRFVTVRVPGVNQRDVQLAADDVNKAGVIVGWYQGKRAEHAFVLKNGKFRTVDDPAAGKSPGQGTAFDGIADSGTISGLYTDSAGHTRGFLYRHGAFHVLAVPGAADTFVGCISPRSGLVVGGYQTGSTLTGFTYRRGIYRRLSYPGAAATLPQCGNDFGRVVGFYNGRTGLRQGFKFTPGRGSAAVAPSAGQTWPAIRRGSGSIRTGQIPAR